MANNKEFVGASTLKSYKTCPRMYYFGEMCNYKPRRVSDALTIGSGFHIGVGVYYANDFNRELATLSMDVWEEQLLAQYYDAINTEGTLSTDDVLAMTTMAKNTLRRYLDFAEANDNFNVILVEQEFDLPIWNPITGNPLALIRHKGTIDMIVQDKDTSRLWIVEHKTAAQFPNEEQLQLDDQINLYVLAAKQLFDLEVEGVIYNVTKKIKDESRVRTEIVKRYYIPKNHAVILSTRNNLYHTVQRVRRDWKFMQDIICPGLHCNWMCDYRVLCTAMQEGAEWQEIAKYMFEVKDRAEQVSWEERIETIAKELFKRRQEAEQCG